MADRARTVVLILSKTFPRKHISAGKKTDFRRSLEAGRKIHTIRGSYEMWKHSIEKVQDGNFCLSLRQWKEKPYRSKQEEVKMLKRTVGYERITMQHNPETGEVKAVVNGRQVENVKQIAENDGMSWNDFVDWFFGQGTGRTLFQGIIIHFTDYRYTAI